ncbi:uncharacterized protein G2W53_041215 [Senna tora]|uniref:Uncharacterized protein n=1 Tax=Senna tora TaxID=362788 RepID=A0A834SEU4_9FABA|nr:uncharacterized protein G2W53_041215 [Senna tora]
MGLLIPPKECEVMSKHSWNQNSWLNANRIQEVQVERVAAHVTQLDRFALYLGIQVDFKLEWDS